MLVPTAGSMCVRGGAVLGVLWVPCALHWPQASESSLSTASWLGRSLLFLFYWTQTFGHIYSVASSLAGEAEGSVCRR